MSDRKRAPWASQTRDRLIDALVTIGFRVTEMDEIVELDGELDIEGETVPLKVTLTDAFPYLPPKVRPTDGAGGNSWHQERDGSLCLWDGASASHTDWSTAEKLIGRVQLWFENARNGWPQDAPDLDLERYWDMEDGLLTYSLEPDHVNGLVRIGGAVPLYEVKSQGANSKRGPKSAFVVDLGEPPTPPRTLDQLIDGDPGDSLQKHLDAQDIGWILVRYERGGRPGLLALRIAEWTPRVTLVAVESACRDPFVTTMRGGLDYPDLRDCKVAIVGVGAVGSAVADQLARCGVGRLTLIDSERLRPGNVIRHLAGDTMVGVNKAKATRQTIIAKGYPSHCEISYETTRLVGFDEGCELLERHDLVVDTSANNGITKALIDVAEFTDKPVVISAITHDGRVARVDRAPRGIQDSWTSDPDLPPVLATRVLREGGCGSPVSPTAPWAVSLLASQTTRTVIDVLRGRTTPHSRVDVLIPDILES